LEPLPPAVVVPVTKTGASALVTTAMRYQHVPKPDRYLPRTSLSPQLLSPVAQRETPQPEHFPHAAHQTPQLPMLRDAFHRQRDTPHAMLAHHIMRHPAQEHHLSMTELVLIVRSPMLIAGARPPPSQSPERAETGHTTTGGFCNQCSPEHTQCCPINPTSPYLHSRLPCYRHLHRLPHRDTRHRENGPQDQGPRPSASRTELPQPRG
jgi:hypothetical protein